MTLKKIAVHMIRSHSELTHKQCVIVDIQ